MPTCSRCGTTDDRHSIKCLQAMALGMAMGVETRPVRQAPRVDLAAGPMDESAPRGWAPVVRELRATLAERDATIGQLREERDRAQRHYDDLAVRYDALLSQVAGRVPAPVAEAPVTQLPPNYYEAHVSAARLAEIQAEVDDLNRLLDMAKSEHLDVKVIDSRNAVITPKRDDAPVRDDDYTDEAVTRAEAQPEVLLELESVLGPNPIEPEPEDQPKTWAQEVKEKRGVPGAWAKPETVQVEEAATRFVAEHLVPAPADTYRTADNGRSWPTYVTAPELLAAYETWRAANGVPESGTAPRVVGVAATKVAPTKKQGPVSDGKKPNCYFGVQLVTDAQAVEPEPFVERRDLSTREQNQQLVDEFRALMNDVRAVKTETIPEPAVDPGHSPEELAVKLAQLKHFGIGGAEGVPRDAAQAAVADLHPTGRDVWKWSPPTSADGVSDADLDATAYQLLIKCMNGLPEQYGFDYKEDVLATAGFVADDVEAALRSPHRVEIRPESWDREKRYPILGFHRGDVSVILGMRTPTKPRVIAAYWSSVGLADGYRVDRHGGGGSKKQAGLPTTTTASLSRLRGMGCEIPEALDEKPVTVTYKGQSLGKVMTARTTTKVTVQSDYQRTLRKMQAIDRRAAAVAV